MLVSFDPVLAGPSSARRCDKDLWLKALCWANNCLDRSCCSSFLNFAFRSFLALTLTLSLKDPALEEELGREEVAPERAKASPFKEASLLNFWPLFSSSIFAALSSKDALKRC